jgi:thiamine kinase-like enzyme
VRAETDPVLAAAFEAVPELAGARPLITPIAEGRTNRNFRIDVESGSYFVRLSDKDTALLGIDRAAEHLAATAAATADVAPAVVAFLPELGCLVTRWLPGRSLAEGDLEHEPTLGRAIGVVLTIHAGQPLPWSFSAFRIVETYRAIAVDRGVDVPVAYDEAHDVADLIEAAFTASPVEDRPCHNDLLAPNFIRDGDRLWLVDYEYAGMGDPFFDLGNLSINNGLSEDAQERMLQHYFGTATEVHRARLGLMRMMSDFREAMWGVAQQGLSTLDIDFVEYAGIHFDRLARAVADPRVDRWIGEAAEGIPA